MDKAQMLKWLEAVAAGKLSPEEAFQNFKDLPYKELGFAKVDFHRNIRNGCAEVIYCPGKTDEQIIAIFQTLALQERNVMATRASYDIFCRVGEIIPEAQYFETARIIALWREKKTTQGVIGVISAGTADLPAAEEAALTAEIMGSKVNRIFDVGVAGIHRLLDKQKQLDQCRVLLVVAGMEGALASVIGGLVDRPIIAVPTSVGYGANFNGLAPLLSMLNSCAGGVGVVNIDNGFGAGVLAHRINILGEK